MTLEEWKVTTQAKVEELQEILGHGDITIQEYEELVEDVLDLEKIYKFCRLESQKIEAQKILEGLSALARLV